MTSERSKVYRLKPGLRDELDRGLGKFRIDLANGGVSPARAKNVVLAAAGSDGHMTAPQHLKMLVKSSSVSDVQFDEQGNVYAVVVKGRSSRVCRITTMGPMEVPGQTGEHHIYFFHVFEDGSLLWIEEPRGHWDESRVHIEPGTLVWRPVDGSEVRVVIDDCDVVCKPSFFRYAHIIDIWIPMGFRREENEVFGQVESVRHLRCVDSKIVLDRMIDGYTHWMGVHDGKPLMLNVKEDETVVSWDAHSKTVSGAVILKSVCVYEGRLLFVSKTSRSHTFWTMKPGTGLVSHWLPKRLTRFPDRRDGEERFRAYAGRIWRTKYVDGMSYQIQDVETGHNLHHEDSGDLYVENITGAQRVEGGWYIFAPGREAETYFWPQDEEINQPCEGGGCAYSALPLSHDKVSREFKINGQVFVTCLATDIDDPVRMAIFRLNLHGVATSVGDCSQTITGNLAYIPHLGELVGWRFYSSTLEIYRWPIPR